MAKTKSARKQSTSKQRKSAAKKTQAESAAKKATSGKAKAKISVQRGAGATAPVVYQTLRERVEAVNTNVGDTLSHKDFLKSNGWS